jgi:N-acetylglucosaminyldiphosphoundecaprenol N-acetyl-beta-D-mannosaminyltransferase
VTTRATVLNGTFDPFTERQAADAIFDALDAGHRGWVCTVNVATLMRMRQDARLQAFVDRALFVVADGQPVVWCSRLFGRRLPERVAGIDLIDSLCARAAAGGRVVYCLGARPDLLRMTIERLEKRHPGLRITGSHGYFDARDATATADAIRASGASLLLVGMGTPRQESFIETQWDRLGPVVAIGVGGSFDVLSGARRRAHPRLAAWGLEWLVRLAQEPVRLLPRYVKTNTHFCVLIAGIALSRAARRLSPR